jgi:hypothetical protein
MAAPPYSRRFAHLLAGLGRTEVAHQLDHVLRKAVGVGCEIAAQRACGDLIGAGRAAQAKVDATRKQGGQRAELLGHHQRSVVRQHDAAGADPDGGSPRRHVTDDDGGRSAGDAGTVVVLGQPVAVIAEALGVPGEIERVAQRLRGIASLHDG